MLNLYVIVHVNINSYIYNQYVIRQFSIFTHLQITIDIFTPQPTFGRRGIIVIGCPSVRPSHQPHYGVSRISGERFMLA